MNRPDLHFFALVSALSLAPACDEHASIGEHFDAASTGDAFNAMSDAGPSPNDAFTQDTSMPTDAWTPGDAGPLPHVEFIEMIVGTVDTESPLHGSPALIVAVALRARVPELPTTTVLETFGPCEALQGAAGATPEAIDRGAVVSARVGASGGFEALGFVAGQGYFLPPPRIPAEGTPVTLRVDLGADGVFERTLPVRTLHIASPTRTAISEHGDVWSANYVPGADFHVTWPSSGRTARMYFSARAADVAVDHFGVLCMLDTGSGAFTLPWAQMNRYLVMPSAMPPHFEVSNVDALITVERGITVRALSSAQSGQTALVPAP